MRKFSIKLLIYIVSLAGVYLFLGSYADGNTDDNYLVFTRQGTNIIMGDSRGAQTIVPDILDAAFPGRRFDNFSFNLTHSPYGEIYLKGLKRKLKPSTKGGIFILSVDPWSVSMDKDTAVYSEESSPLNNMWCYTMDPNYEYLLKNYSQSWYHIYRDRATQGRSTTFLHKNGWLDVNVYLSAKEVARREAEKVSAYQGYARVQEISKIRLKYLQETIQFLKKYGRVYIVRIPSGDKINQIEYRYAPKFNELMRNIAKKHNSVYFDFSQRQKGYLYNDGNHMLRESGIIFTRQLVDSIKKYPLK